MDESMFDEVIEEPLLTEEGFLNPVAMNQLEKAIEGVGPTYQRLAGDSEWNTPHYLYPDYIVGSLAKWAVRQSPYHNPEGLEKVIGYLNACLKRDFQKAGRDLVEMSLCQINEYLHKNLMSLDVFLAWNNPKKGKVQIKFVSSDSEEGDPDCDFIDLDALLHNVCLDLRDEWRADKAFEEKFEKEHGHEHS